MASPHLVSIGYEGRDVDELIAMLHSEGVTTLVDVRLTPISRKRGLSKSALRAALQEAGITYQHYRALGNPKDNREAFRHGAPSAYQRFEVVLGQPDAGEALKHVTELLDGERVALLCYERDHAQCHRSLVVDALRDLDPDLLVRNV